MAISRMSGFRISRVVFAGKVGAQVAPYRDQRLLLQSARGYATLGKLEGSSKGSTAPRKAVTVTNDDGRVPWNDLTRGEKAARTTQQTFNWGIVLAGATGTVFGQTLLLFD